MSICSFRSDAGPAARGFCLSPITREILATDRHPIGREPRLPVGGRNAFRSGALTKFSLYSVTVPAALIFFVDFLFPDKPDYDCAVKKAIPLTYLSSDRRVYILISASIFFQTISYVVRITGNLFSMDRRRVERVQRDVPVTSVRFVVTDRTVGRKRTNRVVVHSTPPTRWNVTPDPKNTPRVAPYLSIRLPKGGMGTQGRYKRYGTFLTRGNVRVAGSIFPSASSYWTNPGANLYSNIAAASATHSMGHHHHHHHPGSSTAVSHHAAVSPHLAGYSHYASP